jgi:hypothetical protein
LRTLRQSRASRLFPPAVASEQRDLCPWPDGEIGGFEQLPLIGSHRKVMGGHRPRITDLHKNRDLSTCLTRQLGLGTRGATDLCPLRGQRSIHGSASRVSRAQFRWERGADAAAACEPGVDIVAHDRRPAISGGIYRWPSRACSTGLFALPEMGKAGIPAAPAGPWGWPRRRHCSPRRGMDTIPGQCCGVPGLPLLIAVSSLRCPWPLHISRAWWQERSGLIGLFDCEHLVPLCWVDLGRPPPTKWCDRRSLRPAPRSALLRGCRRRMH